MGRAGCAGALLLSCTLENSTVDDPEGNAPVNAWRDGPAPRSVEIWSDPGENLLAALAEVEQNDQNQVLPAQNRVLGNLLGEAGAYFSAVTQYQPLGVPFRAQAMQCNNSNLPDAVEELCERITDDPDDDEDQDGEQMVFINTAPHAPYQRTILRKILSCAKDAGYTYLALEALAEDAATLTARGHVSRSMSGPSMREPQLARLVEDALELDYQLVNFDVPEPCETCGFVDRIRQQASEQAENLIAGTLEVDPAARVLVLAGPFQSFKQPWGPNAPFTTSLAAHVWEQSGVEPYAIDQIAIDLPGLPFGASSPSPPSGMYMASGPNNGQCMGQYAPPTPNGIGALNTVIVHVPPRADERRWDWLHAPAEERRSITASCGACTPEQRLLVQVFPAGIDETDRVAMDQALCVAGAPCELVLPAATYRVLVWSEDAQVGAADVDLTATATAEVSF